MEAQFFGPDSWFGISAVVLIILYCLVKLAVMVIHFTVIGIRKLYRTINCIQTTRKSTIILCFVFVTTALVFAMVFQTITISNLELKVSTHEKCWNNVLAYEMCSDSPGGAVFVVPATPEKKGLLLRLLKAEAEYEEPTPFDLNEGPVFIFR